MLLRNLQKEKEKKMHNQAIVLPSYYQHLRAGGTGVGAATPIFPDLETILLSHLESDSSGLRC